MAGSRQSLIRSTARMAFSPVVSGALLFALEYAPERIQEIIRSIPFPFAVDLTILKAALRLILGLQILRITNRALNTSAANNWRFAPQPGWDWSSEIAIVTGGCSGIGESLVRGLVSRGVEVIVLDVQPLPAHMKHQQIRYYCCDVTDPDAVAHAADAIRRDVGHPSIVINNAGVSVDLSILKTPPAAVQKTFGVNSMAHWFLVQQFVPRMVQLNKGHIVTIASLASFVALPRAAAYSATKAAALAFHESLTCELKHIYKAPGVITTIVHPNFVRTPLIGPHAGRLEARGVRLLTSDEVAEQVLLQIYQKKGGQVFIPQNYSIVSGIRGWPTWIQELLRDRIGKGAGTPS